MRAPAPALPPVAFQVAAINIDLDSVMFLTFLTGLSVLTNIPPSLTQSDIFLGIYTTVYFGTVYLYGKYVYSYELHFF